jgi:hypothetical protein
MTRISVGFRDEESFSFECNNCCQKITGKLLLNQREGRVNGFEFNGASEVTDSKFPKHDYVFNYHPVFPTPTLASDPSSMMSPFIAATGRYREDLDERIARYRWFEMAAKDASDLARLVRCYQQGKWDQFETTVKEFDLLKELPLEKAIDKNRALYQILELFIGPFVTSKDHKVLISYMMNLLMEEEGNHKLELHRMIETLLNEGILPEVQGTLLKLYPRFFGLADEFRPIIMEWDPQRPDLDFSKEIEIEGRSGFDALKTLYVDAYEAVARGITFLMGVINLKKRGDFNAFLPHPAPGINKGKDTPFAKNLVKFHHAPNGAKWGMLHEDSVFSKWLEKALNPKLRNAIGHNTINFDPQEGLVTYFLDKQRTQMEAVPYGDFLFTVLRSVVRAHQMNHFVKMLYVHHYLMGPASSP